MTCGVGCVEFPVFDPPLGLEPPPQPVSESIINMIIVLPAPSMSRRRAWVDRPPTSTNPNRPKEMLASKFEPLVGATIAAELLATLTVNCDCTGPFDGVTDPGLNWHVTPLGSDPHAKLTVPV